MKKHNFSAGPSILPDFAYEKTIEAIRDYAGTGISIMSISHRSKEFESTMKETVDLYKKLLNIPEGYSVLFLGGGASTQFTMVPYNLLKNKAFYVDSGHWAAAALKEAKLFGEVQSVSTKDVNYTVLPKGYTIPKDVDYCHITTNNTIYGTELKEDINSPVPLVADMSSDFMSRPVDVSKYALIYAGAQKNVGPAGVTVVIVKNDVLGKVDRPIPTMLNYKVHIEKESMHNTPPCVNVYTMLMTLKWLENLGGLAVMQKMNEEKAKILYDYLDSSKIFVGTVKEPKDRSLMNITFVLKEQYKELEEKVLSMAKEKGIVGIKGHRSVGGFRASTYNALPKESVQYLVDCLKEFEKNI